MIVAVPRLTARLGGLTGRIAARRGRVGAHRGRARRGSRRRLPRPLHRPHGDQRAARRPRGAARRALFAHFPVALLERVALPGRPPMSRPPGGPTRASDAVRRGAARGRQHPLPPLVAGRRPGRAVARGAGRAVPMPRDAGGWAEYVTREAPAGHPLSLPHRRRDAGARPGRPLPARRRARGERGRRSPRLRLARRRLGRAAARAPRLLRAARGHVHARGHVRGASRASSTTSSRSGSPRSS